MIEYVTLVDEDGKKEKVTLDDAVIDWICDYDWQDCLELAEEYFSVEEFRRMIYENMTIEQKFNFLEKKTDENIEYLIYSQHSKAHVRSFHLPFSHNNIHRCPLYLHSLALLN